MFPESVEWWSFGLGALALLLAAMWFSKFSKIRTYRLEFDLPGGTKVIGISSSERGFVTKPGTITEVFVGDDKILTIFKSRKNSELRIVSEEGVSLEASGGPGFADVGERILHSKQGYEHFKIEIVRWKEYEGKYFAFFSSHLLHV